MKIQREPEKDQSGISVDFTHFNDYLVSRLGAVELSGQFFFSETVEKKNANVENEMMRTDWGVLPCLQSLLSLFSRWGHMASAGPAFLGFKIHVDLGKILRNVGCELWVCTHLILSLGFTPHNAAVFLAAGTSFHFPGVLDQIDVCLSLCIPLLLRS